MFLGINGKHQLRPVIRHIYAAQGQSVLAALQRQLIADMRALVAERIPTHSIVTQKAAIHAVQESPAGHRETVVGIYNSRRAGLHKIHPELKVNGHIHGNGKRFFCHSSPVAERGCGTQCLRGRSRIKQLRSRQPLLPLIRGGGTQCRRGRSLCSLLLAPCSKINKIHRNVHRQITHKSRAIVHARLPIVIVGAVGDSRHVEPHKMRVHVRQQRLRDGRVAHPTSAHISTAQTITPRGYGGNAHKSAQQYEQVTSHGRKG